MVFEYILPLAIRLCQDVFPNVRHEASSKMYVLLKILYSEKVYRECIIRSIIDFS